MYQNFRSYGSAPYQVVVVHGGPGAPGEMAPVAEKLSEYFGVLEPLQKGDSIASQVEELRHVICGNCTCPVVLIGWSWGAMLSLLFTARYQALVKKLVLISSGPLENAYVKMIDMTRFTRLSYEQKGELEDIRKQLVSSQDNDKETYLRKYAKCIFQADSYDPIVSESVAIECQYELHQKVWNEASALRDSGQLIACAENISRPVVAIHGAYDPRPVQGVEEPLSKRLSDFRCHVLDVCGHYPWLEKMARDAFYEVLRKEIIA